jgi:Reverse transcriptase (RNA-dependent DNA polymerase)/Endonuclease-reverse transcriptase
VASLELDTELGKLTIINVYNPRDTGLRIKEWTRVQEALQQAQGEILLLGDFNTHHPAWGDIGIACEAAAEHLRNKTKKQDLKLTTPADETTWRRGRQATVIDLTFMTTTLQERLLFCGPEERWAMLQDHISIRINLDLQSGTNKQATRKRYALAKLDLEKLRAVVRVSRWAASTSPLESLQAILEEQLLLACPKSNPCPRARPEWSPLAASLLTRVKQARRRYTCHHRPEDRQSYKSTSNQLKHELRRNSRALWRNLVSLITTDQRQPHNKGLWKLSKWSRHTAGKPHSDPHLPALRRQNSQQTTTNDQTCTEILVKKFFPPPPVTPPNLAEPSQDRRALQMNPEVTKKEIKRVLKRLPRGKAPGPDRIPNEILSLLAPDISTDLAQALTKVFAEGSIPSCLKESVTITIRKEGKKDYLLPGSYRPIALKNALAKVIEKVLANRLSQVAETYNLLSWNQIEARKERSTLSAIGLLTTCVQTAWKAHPECTVSMLSLDLAGAFNNVLHNRLLEILYEKGFLRWIIMIVASFLQARRTRLAYTGYESEWIDVQSGILQGSPLSPILFLFFISGLLELFRSPSQGVLGFGFVDDTNLIAYGSNAAANCRRLTDAHTQCKTWAQAHGAKFAPDKYQLIHFTRRRRHAANDLASTVEIEGHKTALQIKAIRVLGVWLDPKLTWKEHIAHAARKGSAASEAAARLATSTWGPSTRHTRLLYTAIARPTLSHGAQEWGIKADGSPLLQATLAP